MINSLFLFFPFAILFSIVSVWAAKTRNLFPYIFVFSIGLDNINPFPNTQILTFSKLSIGVLMIAQLITGQFKTKRMNISKFIPIILWMVYASLSFFWSINPSATSDRVTTLLLLLVSIILINGFIESKKDILNFIEAIILFGVTNATIMIYQYFQLGVGNLASQQYRSGGWVGNANDNAVVLGIALILVWGLYLIQTQHLGLFRINSLKVLAIVVCSAGLLFTASRAGIIAATSAIILQSLLISRFQNKAKFRAVLVLLAMIPIGILLYHTFPEQISYIITRFSSAQTDQWSGRYSGYELAWLRFSQNPVFGYGLESFRFLYQQVYGVEQVAHNTYLAMLVEGGIISFTLFLWIIISRIVPIFNLFKAELKNKIPGIGWLLIFAIYVVLVNAFSLDLHYFKTVWLLIGLSTVLIQLPHGKISGIGKKIVILSD
jgi:O-antigen ligase